MFWRQLSLIGSTMGNDEEFVLMLQFVSKHKILPQIDSIRPFNKIVTAFNDIGATNRVGKIVLEL